MQRLNVGRIWPDSRDARGIDFYNLKPWAWYSRTQKRKTRFNRYGGTVGPVRASLAHYDSFDVPTEPALGA